MATVINTTFKLKRGLEARWAEVNPILAQGEPGFVLDLNRLKIGDGVTAWNDLPYLDSEQLLADNETIIIENNIIKLKGFIEAQAGAQLIKDANGELAWKLPSTDTIDGLTTAITQLQTEMLETQGDVELLKGIVVTSDDNLIDRVTGLEHKVNDTGIGTIDALIDSKINDFAAKITDNGTVDTIKELIDYVAEHGPEVDDMISDITELQLLVGEDTVENQIAGAIAANNQAINAINDEKFISKVEGQDRFFQKKYEVLDTPEGTLIDYRDNEIRIMCPAGTEFKKQSVGIGGDANTYYITFKTFAPDEAVGYKEHLGNESDAEILTDLKTDMYGRKYQPTWLGVAKYDEASDTWSYYGKNSSTKTYIGWDYGIDWYNASGVIVASDKIRINLSNENCHNTIEPYYMANTIKSVAINGTVLDAVDRQINVQLSDDFLINGNEIGIKQITWDMIVPGETELVLDGGDADLMN